MERNSQADRSGAAMPSGRGYRETASRVVHITCTCAPTWAPSPGRRAPGAEPAIVPQHGFPDNPFAAPLTPVQLDKPARGLV
jgi:hypothetical protein